MLPHHHTSSGLTSGAATHGVPPMLSLLAKLPKPVLPFPFPVINSSTFLSFFLPFFFLITIALHIIFLITRGWEERLWQRWEPKPSDITSSPGAAGTESEDSESKVCAG